MPYLLSIENVDLYEQNNLENVIKVYAESLVELELLEINPEEDL
jgi:hypothetical protein